MISRIHKKLHRSDSIILIIVTIIFAVFFWIPASATAQIIQSGSVLLDTHGYTTGQLSHVAQESRSNQTLNKAYIGQLLLGNDSTSFSSLNGLPLELDGNPWTFCLDRDDFESIEDFIGKDVVVEFKTPRSMMFLSCPAIAELITIDLVAENQFPAQVYFEGDIAEIGMDIGYGIEFGRITNAIKNKNTFREYYLTLQVGGNGSKFSHYIITDDDLYDFAVMNLKSGAMVKIHYKKRLNMRQSINRQLIKGIETIESPDSN